MRARAGEKAHRVGGRGALQLDVEHQIESRLVEGQPFEGATLLRRQRAGLGHEVRIDRRAALHQSFDVLQLLRLQARAARNNI